MSMSRRPRWHHQPPAPPSPRIIHLTRRPRRKPTKQLAGKPLIGKELLEVNRRKQRAKLETLFDQERAFARTVPIVLINSSSSGECERRERVEEELEFTKGSGLKVEFREEEKWRFQAEILRAECNFLRMEKEIALKKLELNRVQTKRTLQSAVETLLSGKTKIHEGKSIGVVLEEIKDLEDKLMDLQRCSGVRDFEIKRCGNFDKQASVLQRRLEKLGETMSEEKCVNEIREMAEASLAIKEISSFDESHVSDRENHCKDVEILKREMERLSKGMLERMEEEYGSMLSSASASASSSASNSRRIEAHPPTSLASAPAMLSQNRHYQEAMWREETKGCSGQCKSIVRKIVEQVRAEMEEWSQMQQMLERVKEEMEELHAFRDFWKNRALDSDERVQSLQSAVQEWKQRARASEAKVSELEKQISKLKIEVGRLKTQKKSSSSPSSSWSSARTTTSLQQQTTVVTRESLKEKEKRVLICSLKENKHYDNRGNNNACNGGKTKQGREKKEKEEEDGWWRRKGHEQEVVYGSYRKIRSKSSVLQDIGNLSASPSSPVLQKNSCRKDHQLFSLRFSEISHPGDGGSICGSEGSLE